MKVSRPAVKTAFPIGDHGLLPVPNYLKIYNLLNREQIFLYNPFDSGLSVKVESPQSLTFAKVADGIIVDDQLKSEPESKSRARQEQFRLLHETSHTYWDVAVATFMRLAVTPKRDDGWKQNISPDMGLVIDKPTRKPDTPKISHKRKPKAS